MNRQIEGIKRMDKNIFYRQAIEALTGSLNIEDGLKNCIQFLQNVLPANVLSVHLWDENLCSLRILATANKNKGHLCNILIPVAEAERHIPRWETNYDIKIVNNYLDDPISELVQEHLSGIYGYQSYSHLVSRVMIGEKRICDIVLLATGSNRFTQEHATLFSTLDSPFGIAVSNSLQHLSVKEMHSKLLDEHERLKRLVEQDAQNLIIGSQSGLKGVVQKIEAVSSTNAPVLINGETGVGKDVVAKAIQLNSTRAEQAYIRVNCGAIPESLLDSELFGHEKGSFTGATERKIGRFERAHNGTIFLDEVGELSKAAQVRLLRVLQNGEIERVGSKNTINIDVRIIAATNRSLESMVEKGEFRADLYYRLCLFPIFVPPLRNRLEDIPLFVDHFIKICADKFNIRLPEIAHGEIANLQSHYWPGNVRELVNVIERSVISCRNQEVVFSIFTDEKQQTSRQNESVSSEQEILTLAELNKRHIESVLKSTNGKIQGRDGAADILDINPHTLRSRMTKLGVSVS